MAGLGFAHKWHTHNHVDERGSFKFETVREETAPIPHVRYSRPGRPRGIEAITLKKKYAVC